MSNKKIQLIYTGGTLGMLPTETGLAPSEDFAERLAEALVTQASIAKYDWAMTSLSPLLDSANMRPQEWGQIAQAVRDVADQAERVVVLHGTDTLAFTGAALSFLLADLEVPVVVTGAMAPLGEPGSDALDNVVLSLTAALNTGEVCLCFGGQTMPANRAIKMAGAPAGAFVAWHGQGGAPDQDARKLLTQRLLETPNPDLRVPVAPHRVMPGEPPEMLRCLAAMSLDGVVLAVYGSGTIPSEHVEWMTALTTLCESGAAVVAVSQSPKGVVEIGKYAASAPLADLGVIDGGDMTAEAAYAKLVVLTALGFSGEERARLMGANLCGERGG